MFEYGQVYLDTNDRILEEYKERFPAGYALAVLMSEEDDWEE